MKFLLILGIVIVGTVAHPGRFGGGNPVKKNGEWDHAQKEAKCGYESCPVARKDMLNLHLVPHTHDDVGWLKTVDQYYYGSKTSIQRAGVQYILDSVIEALLHNPERKFIYVESAFFFKWWNEQTAELQEAVKELVQQGRLEFINGAWSMNDEAAAHYQSLIDQYTWGLGLLNDTFGECGRPRAGWQIDPFGHSREQASLLAQMGYDGLFFARLDYADRAKREANKDTELIWKSSENLKDSELFTTILYTLYQAPPGFCFDVLCSDEPFVDGPNSAENNVDQRIDAFLEWVNGMAQKYRSNNLILTMGGDFTYQDAGMYFKNLDKLIKYTNARQQQGLKVNAFYSTPTCYLKALHEADLSWPTKSDDFFPYASDPHTYWTGYYTSRPTSKRFERVGNHLLQVCKQLTALSPATRSSYFQNRLTVLRDAIGVMQHHDAITGTEKQHVADDYARMLHTAFEACGENTNEALKDMTKTTTDMKFESCHLLNISQCAVSETKETFVVTLYNPMGHSTYQYARLPVNGNNYVVRNSQGDVLTTQMIPLPDTVFNLKSRDSIANQELVFLADEIPPMGFTSFFVTEAYDSVSRKDTEPLPKQQVTTIGNKYLSLYFNYNGFLNMVNINGESHWLQQNFLYYEGALGNNQVAENRSSGAYIFRPNGTEKHVTSSIKLQVYKGDHVQEVHQIFNDWISQVIRVYEDEQHVEFEWMVGPIPIEDDIGKEIVTRYQSDIKSNGVFWTDANGREMIKRVRNHRDTWNLELAEPVSGNYFPVTAKIALEDKNQRMAVLNDRAQGGTSMQDGVLELMVHRRLLKDDAFGVGEALNETAYGSGLIARGKHYLMLGPPASQKAKERFLQNQVLTPAWMFLSDATDLSFRDWQSSTKTAFSALPSSLPMNVNLLTFEPWKQPFTFLIRFEHLLEQTEDPLYSAPVTINLKDVFSKFNIYSVRETTLGGNQWKEDKSRLHFSSGPVPLTHESVPFSSTKPSDVYQVTLGPMEIRTFVMEMSLNN
ncbi:lysosomal alpha-mannosidase-like isoform X3 [Topomyia yanbarensis]|uniref:lysosomal alpha-mannosidase-like isoform X3 n=1 Tax=Topomyia yanbarensis TaxID=2498891 RepID=UPI00273B39F6|nr:lysosomal alpha-mannosidase-like isoform X3 [Topomyia yanbarensis]